MQRKSKETKPKDRKGGSSGSKHKKKAKSGLSSNKTKPPKAPSTAPKKAWGKDSGNKNAEDDSLMAARGVLKPVKVKLDNEGRNTIMDILHQLHVAGMDDGPDEQADADKSESEDDEDEGGDEESSESDEGDDGEDGNIDDDGDDDEDDLGKGHGDFEYDGSFGDMANLISDLTVNNSSLVEDDDEEVAESTATKKSGKRAKNSKEPGSQSTESPQATKPKRTANSVKSALRSNISREKLLATMVEEDRKLGREERAAAPEGLSSAVIAAAAVGAGSVSRNYRRPDPPSGGGKGSEKVRLEVCSENKKTGAPDLNGKKMMVFDRKEPIDRVIQTCKAKLHMKKKARAAAVLEGEEVVDWLTNLSWVPNGAVVFITASAAGGASAEKSRQPSASAAANTPSGGIRDAPTIPAKTGDALHLSRTKSLKIAGEGAVSEVDEEDEEEALALAALTRIRESYVKRAKGRERERNGDGSGSETAQEEASRRMLEQRRTLEKTDRFRQMMSQRRNLPAFAQREDIVNTIRENQVVVLSGETGCGKTTQVPQFVLDSIISRGQGGKCNIICTQPRRISAVGVAERVAAERCDAVGGTVGYQIRLESRMGPSTRLLFCTTGILLRRLTSDDTLAGVSHIMVDEVHERDLQTDFLLVILRDLLPKRPDLRVVLMSATLQANLFTKYFNDCPAISIPGRTFPVEIHYMDHFQRVVRGSKTPAPMPRVSGPSLASVSRQTSGSGKGSSTSGRGKAASNSSRGGGQASARGRQGGGLTNNAADFAVEFDPLAGEPLDLRITELSGNGNASASAVMVSPKCEDKVDYDVMLELVDHIMTVEAREAAKKNAVAGRGSRGGGYSNPGGQPDGSWRRGSSRGRERGGERRCRGTGGEMTQDFEQNSEDPLGAILIFLPGFAEIDQLVRALERHPRIGRGASRIFPLHSSLPSHQQKSIFQRMPVGVRKIVVSTNIAETSVTIDDCTHVIDAGRVREMRYDPITRMSCLVEVWISKASASQRAGRAGRVRAGQCWRLYPETFHESYMPSHTLAEMLRTPLEELVLQVLLLELGSPAEFLERAIEPPPPKMLRAALRNLYDLQAILIMKNSLRPILTPLGYHLAHLPMDARVGKLLLVGAILQCLDPILTIAAALSYKAPFQRPFGEQAKADVARQRFAQHKSDHLAIVEAFGAWRNKRRNSPYDDVRRWCRENFLSFPTLEMMASLREQFRQQLVEVGFTAAAVPGRRASGRDAVVAASNGAGGSGIGGRGPGAMRTTTAAPPSNTDEGFPGERDPDRNAGSIALIQSALCAGLYPNVAAFVRPDPRRQLKKGHFVTRDDMEPVFMHPSSVNHGRFASAAGSGRQVWVMYHSKMKTKQVYLHDATYATPFSLMLWGARIRHDRSLERTKKEGIEVIVDKWLKFRMNEKTAVAFKAMRRELNNLLVGKIEDPSAETGPLSGPLVACLGRLLDMEARCQ